MPFLLPALLWGLFFSQPMPIFSMRPRSFVRVLAQEQALSYKVGRGGGADMLKNDRLVQDGRGLALWGLGLGECNCEGMLVSVWLDCRDGVLKIRMRLSVCFFF